MGDELGASELGATDLTGRPLEELIGLGDSPIAHSLRRRRREIDHPDITVAGHDANAS